MSGRDYHPLRRRRDGNKGIALLAVLFGLAVLSVLLTASMNRSYTHTALHKQITADLIARAEFEGALQLVALKGDVSLSHGPIRLRAIDALGLVDVNTASEEILTALLTALDMAEPEKRVKRILERRSRARRWTDQRELIRLNLISFEEFAKLRPHLTVFSGLPAPAFGLIPEDSRVLLELGGYIVPDITQPIQGGQILEITANGKPTSRRVVKVAPNGTLRTLWIH